MSEKGNKILYVMLSLLLAIVFWLYVDDNTMSGDFNNVPVDFIGAEDTLPSRGLMLAEGGEATVDLKLSGPRSVISALRPGDIRAQVNLTSINAAGPYSMTYNLVYPEDVNSSDITVERRSRSSITVRVSSLYSREIPISVDVVGSVADSYIYMAERRTVEPQAITLSGLQGDVDQVVSARVVVDITDAAGTVQQDCAYELLDAEGNKVEVGDLKVSDQLVRVTVPVYLIKELPLVPKFVEKAGSKLDNVTWDIEPKAITVAGDPLSLETIDEIPMGEIDLSTYLTDWEDDLEIKLPAGCENIGSGSKTAHLSIRFHDLEMKTLTVTNIKATGLSERQSFDPITNSVDVVLRGPAADLEQVMEENVRIVVDLTEYTSDATVALPAKVLVDGYSEVGAVGTYTVSGKIIS